MPQPEPHLAILGPGLLGGSLALAAKADGAANRVSLWGRRQDAIDHIRLHHLADTASTDLAEATAGATLIVLATPVEIMPALAEQLARLPLAPGTLITDVGSVKGSVVRQLEPLFNGTNATFLGSHPMAGSEKTGLEAARADLFRSQNAACILTPTDASTAADVQRLTTFWQTIGCRTSWMSAAVHDELVARISHLPHLIAASAARVCLKDPSEGRFGGGGLRDTTRVAAGNPAMWAEIVTENREALIGPLRETIADLREILASLESGDQEHARQWLATAKQRRDPLNPPQ